MPRNHRRRRPTQEDLAEAVALEGITDQRLLDALRVVPRASFVPPSLAERAYHDVPLPIPRDQVTTQPSLMARMVAGLALGGSEKVLEIGTGYGFQTALLARLGGFVWSIERWPDIAKTARANLTRQGVENVKVIVGDGTEGLPDEAPFEAILVSAAFPDPVGPLAEQLAEAGRLVQPIGSGGAEAVDLFAKRQGNLVRLGTLTGAHFVRLYGKHGYQG